MPFPLPMLVSNVSTHQTKTLGESMHDKAPIPGRRSPVMRGTFLKVAVWLLESPLGGIIAAKSLRDSGIPQVMSQGAQALMRRSVCVGLVAGNPLSDALRLHDTPG